MIYNENGEILNNTKFKWEEITDSRGEIWYYSTKDIDTKKFKIGCNQKYKFARVNCSDKSKFGDYIKIMEKFILSTNKLISNEAINSLYKDYLDCPSVSEDNLIQKDKFQSGLILEGWVCHIYKDKEFSLCGDYNTEYFNGHCDVEHGWSITYLYDGKNFVFNRTGLYGDVL